MSEHSKKVSDLGMISKESAGITFWMTHQFGPSTFDRLNSRFYFGFSPLKSFKFNR